MKSNKNLLKIITSILTLCCICFVCFVIPKFTENNEVTRIYKKYKACTCGAPVYGSVACKSCGKTIGVECILCGPIPDKCTTCKNQGSGSTKPSETTKPVESCQHTQTQTMDYCPICYTPRYVCINCEKVIHTCKQQECNHSYQYTYLTQTTHNRKCTKCGNQKNDTHSYTEVGQCPECNTQQQKCKCGHIKEHEHCQHSIRTLIAVRGIKGKHEVKCDGCGKSWEANCEYNYKETSCTTCGEKIGICKCSQQKNHVCCSHKDLIETERCKTCNELIEECKNCHKKIHECKESCEHKYVYKEAQEKHEMTCEKCGNKETAQHNYSTMSWCSKCESYQYKCICGKFKAHTCIDKNHKHTYLTPEPRNNTQHRSQCANCNEEKIENHDMKYYGGTQDVCVDCGYAKTHAHIFDQRCEECNGEDIKCICGVKKVHNCQKQPTVEITTKDETVIDITSGELVTVIPPTSKEEGKWWSDETEKNLIQTEECSAGGKHHLTNVYCANCDSNALKGVICKKCNQYKELIKHTCAGIINTKHTCVAFNDYIKDKNYHWKECVIYINEKDICGKTVENKEKHKDDNKDGICDKCKYGEEECVHKNTKIENCIEICQSCNKTLGEKHTIKDMKYDDENHWSNCEICNKEINKEAHQRNEEGICDICQHKLKDEFDTSDNFQVNDKLEGVGINLRSKPNNYKFNGNIFKLNEKITYYIDYANSGEDINDKITIKLKLPLDIEVISIQGGMLEENTIIWEHENGLKKGEGGTKQVMIKYKKMTGNNKMIQPVAEMCRLNKIIDSSAVIQLIVKDYDIELTKEHKPYLKGYTDGTIKPDNSITRAEAAIVFTRVFGIDKDIVKSETKFKDLDGLYEEAVNAIKIMEKYGLINGYEDGTYRPQEPISRVEFMAIIARKIQSDYNNDGLRIKETNENVLLYNKYNYSWATDEMTFLLRLNMMGPALDEIDARPTSKITRAEVAQLMNLYQFRAPAALKYAYQINFKDLQITHELFGDLLEATREKHTCSYSNIGMEN